MVFAGSVLIWGGTDHVGTHTDKECGQDGDHDFRGTRDTSQE